MGQNFQFLYKTLLKKFEIKNFKFLEDKYFRLKILKERKNERKKERKNERKKKRKTDWEKDREKERKRDEERNK